MLRRMNELPVIRCPASQRAASLRQLHAARQGDQGSALALAIESMQGAAESAWDGLLTCRGPDGGDLAASSDAIWVQPTPGNTAVVWPPAPESPWLVELFAAAANYVDSSQIALAQMIVSSDEGFLPQRLARGGFAHLADLLYLFAEPHATGPLIANEAGLRFVPHAGDENERLAALLEQTYEGTLDCPALDGARPIAEALAGYRAQGRFLAEHWYFVQDDMGRDVGALLLADHPAAGNWELVYMGLIPAARGRRLGERVVDYALVAASRGGAQRLVLAVDAANEPALSMYQRAGFVEWDRRTVYARIAATRQSRE
jgi:mycothiol synthase